MGREWWGGGEGARGDLAPIDHPHVRFDGDLRVSVRVCVCVCVCVIEFTGGRGRGLHIN